MIYTVGHRMTHDEYIRECREENVMPIKHGKKVFLPGFLGPFPGVIVFKYIPMAQFYNRIMHNEAFSVYGLEAEWTAEYVYPVGIYHRLAKDARLTGLVML